MFKNNGRNNSNNNRHQLMPASWSVPWGRRYGGLQGRTALGLWVTHVPRWTASSRGLSLVSGLSDMAATSLRTE